MKNKKGSHVGMILSFLVFITFIGFLYSVIEPVTKSNEDKLELIKYLKVDLLKEFSTDLTSLTINVSSTTEDCIEFDLPDSELEYLGVVSKFNGNVLDTFADSESTQIEFDNESLIKVFYSSEFDKGIDLEDCEHFIEGDEYHILLFKTTNQIFGSKIINISNQIKSFEKYNLLKNKLNIGFGNEFGFVFMNESKEVIVETKEKEVTSSIFVEEFPIQYMDNEANIKFGFLTIKVW